MVIPALIEHKRDGGALTAEQWSGLIRAYVAGQVPDYQMSALLMAIYFRGLEPAELAALTDTMIDSGDRLHFDGHSRPVADKHSTGGVGDKVSLLLAPMVASCGVAVPMMSGRGLGHTGGTLDKLESIPGFRTNLSLREARAQVDRLGCAMLGQTPEIAPADKRLYGLRDVTATVESIPLISASIMSKKLAEGLNGLVLDVKTGSGAFLTDLSESIELARTMLVLVGAAASLEEARTRLEKAVTSGRALETFARVVEAQGGNPGVIEDPGVLPQAQAVEVYRAARTGVVAAVEPRRIGRAIVELGGGLMAVEDAVDPTVGFVITVKPGDPVRAGEPIASIFARDEAGIAIGTVALREAVSIGDTGHLTPLISHRITSRGVERLAEGV